MTRLVFVFLLDFEFRVYVLLQNRFRVLVNMNGFWFRVRVLIKKLFFKKLFLKKK